jgi:hypothetical protein
MSIVFKAHQVRVECGQSVLHVVSVYNRPFNEFLYIHTEIDLNLFPPKRSTENDLLKRQNGHATLTGGVFKTVLNRATQL